MRPQSPYPQDDEQRKTDPDFVSNWVFAFSLIAGLLLGLTATRIQGPINRAKAEPWQLHDEARNHYMMAIALQHQQSGDLMTALDQLITLRPAQDPINELAEGACELGSGGYLGERGSVTALRSAVQLYTAQGREGCAELLLPEETGEMAASPDSELPEQRSPATAQPTKAPLRDNAPAIVQRSFIPTPAPVQRRFEARSSGSFCDPARPAVIEVYVVDYLGRGLPGQRIRVRWGSQQDSFFSGLKIDRGDAYADFQMEADTDYAIDMPGAAESLGVNLRTGSCYGENQQSLKSFRVTFVEV